MLKTINRHVLAAGLVLTAMFPNSYASGTPAGADGLADITKTPAYELLGALELLQVVQREGLLVGNRIERPDGSSIVRVTLDSKTAPDPLGARGLGILQVELANSKVICLQSFDLLYNGAGRLIAVFPVFPEEVLNKEPQTTEKWRALHPRYFDLSPYYMEVPRSGAPAEEKWKAFAGACKKDLDVIRAFAEERFKPVIEVYPDFLSIHLPYRLHEIDKTTGEWNAHEFSPMVFSRERDTGTFYTDIEPEEFLRVFRAPAPGKRRTIIPTFPTVYALANITPDETTYLRQVSTKFSLASDSKILIVGPGTGVDTWIASFRTSEPIRVVGINPLEVANTKAAAKITGFKVNAIVGDNVADEKGDLRFPGEKFDAVFWNMPAVWEDGVPAGHVPSLYDSWDGDIGGLVLARFAKALPGLFKPGGRALLWNYAPYADGKNMVAETLKFAGGKEKVFDVEIERFVKRSRPKEEFYKGHLYTLTRALNP